MTRKDQWKEYYRRMDQVPLEVAVYGSVAFFTMPSFLVLAVANQWPGGYVAGGLAYVIYRYSMHIWREFGGPERRP